MRCVTLLGRAGAPFLLAVVVAGCGGGSSTKAGDAAAPAGDGPAATGPDAELSPDAPPPYRLTGRIPVEPRAVLFTRAGEQGQLRARVFDTEGKPLNRPITWESSRPASVTVDGEGRVTSKVDLGSAQIRARAGDIVSDPVLVLIAEPAPGALLVTDAQVSGEPALVDPAKALTPGQAQLRVTLIGVDEPKVGSVMLAREGKAVGGRVLSATPTAGGFEVALEVAPPLTLFRRLDLDASFVIDARAVALAALEMSRAAPARPRGRPGSSSWPPPLGPREQPWPEASFDLGPFECETSATVNLVSGDLSVVIPEPDLRFNVVIRDNASGGYAEIKVLAEGRLIAFLSGGLKILSGFAGELTCSVELASVPVPIGGALATVLGFQVPIGAQVGLGGEVKLSPMEIKPELRGSTTLRVGASYTPATGLVDLSSVQNTFEPRMTLQGFSGSDFEIEGILSVGATSGLDFGSPLAYRTGVVQPLSVLEAFLGAQVDFQLAPEKTQLQNPGLAANYKLSLVGQLGPGSAVQAVLSRLGAGAASVQSGAKVARPLGRSPFGKIMPDKTRVNPDESVNVKVVLDQASLALAGIDNVKEVRLLHATPEMMVPEVMKTFTASPGQHEFAHSWTPRLDQRGVHLFYAIVESKLAPGLPLEVTENSETEILVGEAGWTGKLTWTLMGTDSKTVTAPGMGQTSGTTTTTYMVSGGGEVSFRSGMQPGVLDVTAASARFTYNEMERYSNTYVFSNCTHVVSQTRDKSATGSSTEKPLVSFTEDPFGGTFYLLAGQPTGTATGTEVTMGSDNVTGPSGGVNCSSTSSNNTSPITMPFPGDAFSIMGMIQPGQTRVAGTHQMMVDGVPPRMYQVEYMLQR